MRPERGSRGRPHGPCYRPSGASGSGRENREVVGVTVGGRELIPPPAWHQKHLSGMLLEFDRRHAWGGQMCRSGACDRQVLKDVHVFAL